jgi:hypothetical protein
VFIRALLACVSGVVLITESVFVPEFFLGHIYIVGLIYIN